MGVRAGNHAYCGLFDARSAGPAEQPSVDTTPWRTARAAGRPRRWLPRRSETVGNDRPGSLDVLVASLLPEVFLQRRGLLGRPGNLFAMQDAEVDITQLGDGCPQCECEACGSERIGGGRVGLVERNAVVLTDRAQSPLASPEAGELLVEHVRIDNEHPVQPADSVEQRTNSVPPGLAVQDCQVEARDERDDRHTLLQLVGQHGRDLVDCLVRASPFGSRPLGGDAMHRGRASRYVDAGIHQPGTVSYTHLRAHETVLDLVCRLLLE